MRVAVTGASGFVGARVVRALEEAGHEVVALARDPDRAPGVTERRAFDLADLPGLVEAFRGADAVVHAAGCGRVDAPYEVLGWLEVAASENVARAARRAGVRRFVALSSIDATLGEEPRMDWDEGRSVPRPCTVFGRVQREKEETLIGLGTRAFEPVLLRAGALYGEGGRASVARFVREAEACGALRVVGRGLSFLSSTYVGNLAHAATLAVASEKAAHGVYHVLDRELLGQALFLGRMAEALDLPEPKRVGGAFVESLRARYAPAGLDADEVRRRAYGGSVARRRAMDELGYDPRFTAEEGFDALAAWVKREGGAAAVARTVVAPTLADIVGLKRAAGV